MRDAPAATLQGESILAVARGRPRPALPEGVAGVPGPVVLAGTRVADSPWGPFLELVVARPARLGLHAGWYPLAVVCDGPGAAGAASLWGRRARRGHLLWTRDGRVVTLRWVDGDLSLQARPLPGHASLPVWAPLRALWFDRLGPQRLPGGLAGRARLAGVAVEAGSGPFLGLGGRHLGAVVRGRRRASAAPEPVPAVGVLAPTPGVPRPALWAAMLHRPAGD